MAKKIAVTNQKGGVGKTTTTVNLSACLAEQGMRVLVLDVDPQGNATSGLGVDKFEVPYSVYDLLVNSVAAADALVHTDTPGLDVIPSNIELAGAEVEMVSMLGREFVLQRALEPLADQYDFMLIDCPPSLGLLTVNAMAAADSVMVPIQCEYYALEGLSQLMNTVKLVKKHINPKIEVEGVVLTMYDARTKLSAQVVEEVRKFFRDKVYKSVIPRNVRLGEAPSHGLPIHLYDPKCSGAEAYQALAREILAANGGTQA